MLHVEMKYDGRWQALGGAYAPRQPPRREEIVTNPPTRISRGTFMLGALAAGILPLAGTRPADAASTVVATRSSASLGPLINIPQTWNNCGPAAIAEVLAYWGISRTQAEVQSVLRVDGYSAGMTQYGVPAYARSVGLRSMIGVGGSEALVKALVSNGLPVIVHQIVSLSDNVGHWRPIEAFNDGQGVFVSSDPYLGPDHRITYNDFAQMWALRGNTFIVLYPASRQAALTTIIAKSGWNQTAAYKHDLAMLRAYRLDASPAGTPRSAATGYRYLGMAWDEAHMGQHPAARTYLDLAVRAGANPVEVTWIRNEIA
jgi:hypothetical protein